MQIKKIELNTYPKFRLRNLDIEKANLDLNKRLRFLRKWPQYRLPVKENTKISCDSDFKRNIYSTRISFDPSVKITRDLVEKIVEENVWITGLNFSQEDSFKITPSGLKIFNDEWRYIGREYFRILSGEKIKGKNYLVARMEFLGQPSLDQVEKIKSIVDKIYLPEKNWQFTQDTTVDLWISYEGYFGSCGRGLSYPIFIVDKNFSLDMNHETEIEIEKFYKQMCDFVLDQNIHKNCIFQTRSDTIKEFNGRELSDSLQNKKGVNLRDEISKSTIRQRSKYSPRINVVVFEGTGEFKDRSFRGTSRVTEDLISMRPRDALFGYYSNFDSELYPDRD